MFRCDVNECKCIVESSGELLDIVCDVARAIGGLYNSLKQNNQVSAEVFKRALQHTVKDDSPAWEPSATAIIFDLSKKNGGAPTGQS